MRIESDDLEGSVGGTHRPVYDYGIECGRRQGRLEGGGGALLHNEKGLALKLGLDLLERRHGHRAGPLAAYVGGELAVDLAFPARLLR